MENVMTNGFTKLSENEMYGVDGGISWNDVGLFVAGSGGGTLGCKFGTAIGGPVGGGLGVLIGGSLGVIIYSFFD